MRAISPGDEIEIIELSGVQRSKNRGQTGAGDRPGRKPAKQVCVVERRSKQMLAGEVAVELFQSVNHTRIALEGYPLAQPVVKHGRDQSPLGGSAGLFFDQRRQGNHLVERKTQAGGLSVHRWTQRHIETLDYASQNFFWRGQPGELIRVRVEIPFQPLRRESPSCQENRVSVEAEKTFLRTQPLACQQGRDLPECQSFRDGHNMTQTFPPSQEA